MSEDSQGAAIKSRSALYIDGFNLYHAVNDLGENFLKWCNFWRLGQIIIPQETENLVKVVFCTAYYPGDNGKRIRHERLIRALNLYNVETILGHFSSEKLDCKKCSHVWDKPTEKASDIHLALSIFEDATNDIFDCAYLLTADTDQAATARFLKERFPNKRLVSVSPPGRYHSQHILSHAAGKIALGRDHIERALFRKVVMVEGKPPVIRPHEYDTPDGYVFWDDRPTVKRGAQISLASTSPPTSPRSSPPAPGA